jgi:two-component system response regulator DevR
MNVIVLDDHRMVAQSIAALLSELGGLTVLGVCSDVNAACALIEQQPPDLLVLDVDLGGDDYRDAAQLLHRLAPNANVLFITALGTTFQPPSELRAFTIGVVDKTQGWEQLLNILQLWRAQHGAPAINLTVDQLQRVQTLAPREQRLMKALGNGLLNKEIARSLNLKETTVKTYRKQVATTLGVSGSQLVRLATLYRCWCLNQQNRAGTKGNTQLP